MPQAQRLVLVHVAHVVVAHALHCVGIRILPAGAQQLHKLRVRREVLLDGLLLAAVDDDHLVGVRREALLHHVLDGRSVDYQQHFLRLRLRGGQEARAEAGSGNESLHGHTFLCNVREAPQKRRFVHGVRLL